MKVAIFTWSWLLLLLLGSVASAAPAPSELAPPPLAGHPLEPAEPVVEDLGDGRLRIRNIEIDTRRRQFSVTGNVIDLGSFNAPIEFLAVTRGAAKAYEALLELDVTAVEFNLACILIGLDAERAKRPKLHFDPDPVEGDIVDILVSWQQDGKEHVRGIEELLRRPEGKQEHKWVYTGSYFAGDQFMAEMSGTLIGVVHDPESIIQHQQGLGLGNYGAVTGNLGDLQLLRPPMTITVSVPDAAPGS